MGGGDDGMRYRIVQEMPKTPTKSTSVTEPKLASYEKNLETVIGKRVVAVTGYESCAFDKDTPVFKLCRIVFDDGTSVHVEGEHDTPYIPYEGKK